jgi:transcription antitermination factor NusB
LRRRKARELALKMLYQVELNGEDSKAALENYCKIFPYQNDIVEYALFLLSGIEKEKRNLDKYIEKASEHWKLNRIAYVDKGILETAIFEMLFSPDVPPKVAIDEALELAKKFGTEESKDFVNGILDRILREYYGKRESQE